jgi:hypothetical protein
MRTLGINKTKLWLVRQTGVTDYIDSDGFKTGEKIKVYSTPSIVYINIYPFGGKIMEQIFGKDYSCDMVGISNEVSLLKDDLLFLTLPTSNYDETYDYRLDAIKPSINTKNYGLKMRT